MRLAELSVESIDLGDRFRKDYGNLVELAQSIEENGLIQPIAVKETKNGRYKLLAGGRRLKAVCALELKTILARIFDEAEPLDEGDEIAIELIENLQRKNLTPREECDNIKAFHEAMLKKHGPKINPTDPNDKGWSMVKTALMLNVDPSLVTQKMNLANAEAAGIPVFQGAKTVSDAAKAYKNIKKTVERQTKATAAKKRIESTPEDILKKRLIDSYIIGDVIEHLKKLPNESFDLIEFDPPFAVKLDKDKKRAATTKASSDYTEIDQEQYQAWITTIFKECYRVLKQDRWMLCWFGPEPWQEYIYHWLTGQGFPLQKTKLTDKKFESMFGETAGFKGRRLTGRWVKLGSQAQSMNPNFYLANSDLEQFYYVAKGKPTLNKPGRLSCYHYRPVPPTQKTHDTERPLGMMLDILYTFVSEGARILVPCCGSGKTLLAASNISCEAIGIDLSPQHKDGFVNKVAEGTPGDFRENVFDERA